MKAEYISKYALAKITSTWFLEILGDKSNEKRCRPTIFRFVLRSEGAVNSPSSQWVSGKTLLYIQGMKPQETVECLFLMSYFNAD